MNAPEALDLLDVATILARAAHHIPEGARTWVEFDGATTITISVTHHGIATQTATALDLRRQHPPRDHVQQWARGVVANGKAAVLRLECLDTARIAAQFPWTETKEAAA